MGFIDFCISDYGAIYELLFDGFDNCDTDEEFSIILFLRGRGRGRNRRR